jgi:hypothetical protein
VGDNYLDYCTIGLMPTSQNFIILGTAFMKNYYMIFDYERDVVGLSNLSTNANIFNGKSPKKKPSGGTDIPVDDTTRSNDGSPFSTFESLLNTEDTNVIYAILIIIIVLLVGFIVLLIFCIYYYGFKN